MKCPQCQFEQIEESPDECAKCGVLFEKWQDRLDQLEQQLGREAPAAAAAPHATGLAERPIAKPGRRQYEPTSAASWGSGLMQIGVPMFVIALLSLGLNLVGYEFILLMPLELVSDPRALKLWMMGIGLALTVVGAVMGGALEDD